MCLSDVTKACFKCGEIKTLSEFYKHKAMADGHLNKCKSCAKSDVAKHRNDNIEAVRDYDRQRGNRQTLADKHRYINANPKKRAAHIKVGNAVRDGKLIPQPCEVCGSSEVHGHHCDYSKPLEVMWLCAVHHKEWHAVNGEGLNGH